MRRSSTLGNSTPGHDTGGVAVTTRPRRCASTVIPDRELRHLARERGWEVVEVAPATWSPAGVRQRARRLVSRGPEKVAETVGA